GELAEGATATQRLDGGRQADEPEHDHDSDQRRRDGLVKAERGAELEHDKQPEGGHGEASEQVDDPAGGAECEVGRPSVEGDGFTRDELVDELIETVLAGDAFGGAHASIAITADCPLTAMGTSSRWPTRQAGRCMDLDALAAARAA